MRSSEDEYKSREKYGVKDVTVLSESAESGVDPAAGITGTFRKLSCDY